jgi:hypothetical protein
VPLRAVSWSEVPDTCWVVLIQNMSGWGPQPVLPCSGEHGWWRRLLSTLHCFFMRSTCTALEGAGMSVGCLRTNKLFATVATCWRVTTDPHPAWLCRPLFKNSGCRPLVRPGAGPAGKRSRRYKTMTPCFTAPDHLHRRFGTTTKQRALSVCFRLNGGYFRLLWVCQDRPWKALESRQGKAC